jgi:hypothetical protein
MNIKELQKLITLCRKQGVTSIKMEGVELQLGPEPVKQAKRPAVEMPNFDPGSIPRPSLKPWETETVEKIETDAPTGDELLFWSADSEASQ